MARWAVLTASAPFACQQFKAPANGATSCFCPASCARILTMIHKSSIEQVSAWTDHPQPYMYMVARARVARFRLAGSRAWARVSRAPTFARVAVLSGPVKFPSPNHLQMRNGRAPSLPNSNVSTPTERRPLGSRYCAHFHLSFAARHSPHCQTRTPFIVTIWVDSTTTTCTPVGDRTQSQAVRQSEQPQKNNESNK